MAMSKDRVLFWPFGPQGVVSPSEDSEHQKATRQALQVACGVSITTAHSAALNGHAFLCRPSQYARFTIARAKYGGQNQMARMQPILVTGYDAEALMKRKYAKVIDVSDRPAYIVGYGIYSRPNGNTRDYGFQTPGVRGVSCEVESRGRVWLVTGERYELGVSGTIIRITKDAVLTGKEAADWLALKPTLAPLPR